MKHRRLHFLLPALLAAVLALGTSRELQIRLFPRIVLQHAVESAMDDLQARFDGNPVLHIAACLKLPDQQIRLETSGDRVTGEATLHLSPRRLAGRITGNTLSAAVYADSEALAASSPQLTGDRWLGIAYDSFSEDISQIPLIRWILPEEIRSSWESSLAELRGDILAELPFPAIPEIREDALAQLPLALAAMKTTVTKTVIQHNRKPVECFRILCEADGHNRTFPADGDTSITCAFYLLDSRLILARIDLKNKDQQLQLHLETDGHFSRDPVTLRWSQREGEQEDAFTARIETTRTQDSLSERWQVSLNGRERSFDYQWNPSGETGSIRFEEETIALDLTLQPQGFHLKTGDGDVLGKILFQDFPIMPMPENWTVEVQPGTAPTAPEYLRPNDWTTEELLTLLEGLGDSVILPFS